MNIKDLVWSIIGIAILVGVGSLYVGWISAVLGIGSWIVYRIAYGKSSGIRGGDHGGPDS